MILFIDASVRRESRTKRLADALLKKLAGEVQTVRLEDVDFAVTDEDAAATVDAVLAALSACFGAERR